MDTRKLIRSGPSALMITLPHQWVKSHNLKKGDTIEIESFINKLVISPSNKREEKEVFLIDLNIFERYYELLIYAGFLSDKKKIIIKNIKASDFKKIIKIIRRLSYLKIEEETSENLKLIFIADSNLIDIKKEFQNIQYNIKNFFDVLLMKKTDFEEANEIYEQLSLQVMIIIKLLKIRFLEYNKNEIITYKQLIDSYYFFIKNCKEFMVLSKKLKITNQEYRVLIREGLNYLEQILQNIEKKDLLKILEIQEKIQKIRYTIFEKMQNNHSGNQGQLLLIGEIFKIIENMGYAYINNQ